MLTSYPLHRVRELHVAGGSWSGADAKPIRRDTRDGPVPDELFAWLPHVEAVILELMEPVELVERNGMNRP